MLAMAKVQQELENIWEYEESAELTEKEQAEVTVYVDRLLQDQAGKVDAFCQYLKLAAAEADMIRAESRRLAEKAKALDNRIDYLKKAAAGFMSGNGIVKMKGNAYSIGLRKTEAVNVFDMNVLQSKAPEFVRTEVKCSPDKTLIKQAIRSGEAVPGAELAEREYIQVA